MKQSYSNALAISGFLSLVAFLLVFVNIPWEWNMFMDDIGYNQWMPQIGSITEALKAEVQQYWSLGRFYPVKYLANLIKWKYLPNDPYVFRVFNLSVFLLAASITVAALRPAKWFFIFALGTVFLHKPMLEIIALNPLGETWVILFFSIGIFFLGSNFWGRGAAARIFFLLGVLAKEPTALVFFALGLADVFFFFTRKEKTRLLWAALDFSLFLLSLGVSIYAMKQGSFTQNAYFSTIPVWQYMKDYVYSQARYGLWVLPLLYLIFLAFKTQGLSLLKRMTKEEAEILLPSLLFGLGYMLFMSTQGIVAYQQSPGSWGYFSAGLVLLSLSLRENPLEQDKKFFLFALLLGLSLFISISRWERFVRSYVEPSRAVQTLLLSTTEERTVFIPRGEISMHMKTLVEKAKIPTKVVEIDENLTENLAQAQGRLVLIEFPVYMGELPLELKSKIQEKAGTWCYFIDATNYRFSLGSGGNECRN